MRDSMHRPERQPCLQEPHDIRRGRLACKHSEQGRHTSNSRKRQTGCQRGLKRVNTVFNSRLFCPDREFKIAEKRTAAKTIGIKDPHERDAYTAAISAYHAYANKFNQIEHIAQQSMQNNIDEIKAKVIRRHSIREAIENRKANRK